MFSSLTKKVYSHRLSLPYLRQAYLYSSKSDKTNPSTGDTYEDGKKDIHKPTIDASHQTGKKTEKERKKLENEEQGLSSATQTRQERIPKNEKKPSKTNK